MYFILFIDFVVWYFVWLDCTWRVIGIHKLQVYKLQTTITSMKFDFMRFHDKTRTTAYGKRLNGHCRTHIAMFVLWLHLNILTLPPG